jgi:tRNA pseudouridine38-40 synthase
MRTIKLVLAYDGTAYNGFQKQPDKPSVQQVLEEFLQQVCGEPVVTTGSGRTDAGVHARYQVVSFSTQGIIPLPNLIRVSGSLLPADIVVKSAEEVAAGFNARKDACWKRYVYQIRLAGQADPFYRNYWWQLGGELNLQKMQQAAAYLVGEHDFSGFQSTGSAPVSPVKTIYAAQWSSQAGQFLFRISGNGFVYHMVRNLVWSLVQVGQGVLTPDAFKQQLTQPRGAFLNSPAPAQGLYLDYVSYQPWPQQSER